MSSTSKFPSYTLVGIRSGFYDEDLDAIYQAVQARRVKIGRVNIVPRPSSQDSPSEFQQGDTLTVSLGGGEAESISTSNVIDPHYQVDVRGNWINPDDGTQEPYGLPWGYFGTVPALQVQVLEKVRRGNVGAVRGLTARSVRSEPSITIHRDGDTWYYRKKDLVGRIMTVHPAYWDSLKIRHVLCEEVGRRNIEGRILAVTPNLSPIYQRYMLEGRIVSIRPERFLDFCSDAHALALLSSSAKLPSPI